MAKGESEPIDRRLEPLALAEYISYSIGLHLSPVVAVVAVALLTGRSAGHPFDQETGQAGDRAQELSFFPVEPAASGAESAGETQSSRESHGVPAPGPYPKLTPEEKNGVPAAPDDTATGSSDSKPNSTSADGTAQPETAPGADPTDTSQGGQDLHLLTIPDNGDLPDDGFGVPVNPRDVRPGLPGLLGSVCFVPEGLRGLRDLRECRQVSKVRARVLDVTPRDWTSGFPGAGDRLEWFAIDYSGTLRVHRGGNYGFRLLSDDGSLLFIDGKLVIDNDGQHSPESVSGDVDLSAGEHRIRVQYYQGPRTEVALQLFVTPPGSSERIWTSDL